MVFETLKFPFLVFAFTAIPLIILLLLVKIIIELRRNFLELSLHIGIILLDFSQQFDRNLNGTLLLTILFNDFIKLFAGREFFKNLVIAFQFLFEVVTSKSYFFKLFVGVDFFVFIFSIFYTLTTLIFVFRTQRSLFVYLSRLFWK